MISANRSAKSNVRMSPATTEVRACTSAGAALNFERSRSSMEASESSA